MTAVSVLVTKINNTMNENYRPGAHLRVQSRSGVDNSPGTEQIPLHCYCKLTSQGYLLPILARLAIDASGVSLEKTKFCTPLLNMTSTRQRNSTHKQVHPSRTLDKDGK